MFVNSLVSSGADLFFTVSVSGSQSVFTKVSALASNTYILIADLTPVTKNENLADGSILSSLSLSGSLPITSDTTTVSPVSPSPTAGAINYFGTFYK